MDKKLYSPEEEIFSSVTHGFGTVLAIGGTAVLIVLSVFFGDILTVVSSAIFGGSLIVLYCMSTLYHAISHPKAKHFFRIMDHNTIFFLIAGTYTPITVSILRGVLGWTLFGIIWGVAVVGITLNSINLERFRKPSVVCYILMGWVIVIAIHPLLEAMNAFSLWFLIAGGVFYTVGVFFYAIKKVKYFHSIWHIFTLCGSLCHYLCILFAVLQA